MHVHAANDASGSQLAARSRWCFNERSQSLLPVLGLQRAGIEGKVRHRRRVTPWQTARSESVLVQAGRHATRLCRASVQTRQPVLERTCPLLAELSAQTLLQAQTKQVLDMLCTRKQEHLTCVCGRDAHDMALISQRWRGDSSMNANCCVRIHQNSLFPAVLDNSEHVRLLRFDRSNVWCHKHAEQCRAACFERRTHPFA